jgi:hypothetical protein
VIDKEKPSMDGQTNTGSCLCGAVRFEFTTPAAFRYCHCSRCRKATGSAHAANLFVPSAQFAWRTGEDRVKRFDLPGARRFSVWFCSVCGTRVPHRIRERDDYLVPAGIVDSALSVRPQENIFWASKAEWCVGPDALTTHDEYPPA